ncbi:hypothetical protein EDB89DRAFT_1587765 [Lactarius sanguifluus]|nr:hypothetical protein EDB89DRAFT_1587765 [Lactarius sanguifluus]
MVVQTVCEGNPSVQVRCNSYAWRLFAVPRTRLSLWMFDDVNTTYVNYSTGARPLQLARSTVPTKSSKVPSPYVANPLPPLVYRTSPPGLFGSGRHRLFASVSTKPNDAAASAVTPTANLASADSTRSRRRLRRMPSPSRGLQGGELAQWRTRSELRRYAVSKW